MDFLEPWDLGAIFSMTMLQRTWLTWIMRFITLLGDKLVVFAVVLAAMMFFMRRKRWQTAFCLAMSAATAYALEIAVSEWVQRPRPDLAWIQVQKPASSSFPSGHALLSMTVYGGLALSLADELRRRGIMGRLVLWAGFLLPLLIGFSRMYLGLHFMSDVVGGLCGGLGCAMFFHWVDRKWSEGNTPAPTLAPEAASHFQPQKSQVATEQVQPAASDEIQA